MIAKSFVSALVAAAMVSAQSDSCRQTTISINSNADATNLASCRTLSGNVVVGNITDARIQLDGPTEISGDLTLLNNGRIVSFSSSSIRKIGGRFHMQNVTLLSTLTFSALQEVNEIQWQALPALERLTFGSSGVSRVPKVVISDTILSSLDGLAMTSVNFMDINNNGRLSSYTSVLSNITDELKIQANGRNLRVEMPNLVWAANLTIADVASFSLPQLRFTNGSLRFDNTSMTTFTAPNLTETGGDVAFIGSAALTNISFPRLTTVGGSLSIMNNTRLQSIDSFPVLSKIYGAVKLRGNFTSVVLPALNDVRGAFDVQSTTEIKTSCDVFQKTKDSSQIQGSFTCKGNEANANEDTNTPGTGTGNGTTGGNSAAGVNINFALLGLTLVGGTVALL